MGRSLSLLKTVICVIAPNFKIKNKTKNKNVLALIYPVIIMDLEYMDINTSLCGQSKMVRGGG